MTNPTLDDVLALLSDQYRRHTIQVLRQSPERRVGVDELIVALIQETTATSEQRNQLVLQLHHNHLPKLHEQGLIDYDRDAELVQYRPDQQVDAVIDGITAKEPTPVLDD